MSRALLLVALALPCSAAIAIVSSTATIASSGFTTAPYAVTATISTTGATLLIVHAATQGGSSAPTVSDAYNNAWHALTTCDYGTTGGTIFYAYSAAGGGALVTGGADAVTVVDTSAPGYTRPGATFVALSGTPTGATNPYDTSACAQGFAGSGSIALTTGVASEFVFTTYVDSNANVSPYAVGGPFGILTSTPNTGSFPGWASAYVVASSAGSVTANWSWSGSDSYVLNIAAFKPAAAPAGGGQGFIW